MHNRFLISRSGRGLFVAGLRSVSLVCAILCVLATARAEPRNLDVLKREIRAYVDSGDYERGVARVAAKASMWIQERAAEDARGFAGPQKLAVVLDLDETLLSNWPAMNAADLGYVPDVWDAWVDRGEAPAIEPVRELYRAARTAGVRVIFLTSRTERDRAGTEKNLQAIGCSDYHALIFRAIDAKEASSIYKARERQRLVDEGFVIVANIGDQESDLVGGFAERTFKLPNPFYLTE